MIRHRPNPKHKVNFNTTADDVVVLDCIDELITLLVRTGLRTAMSKKSCRGGGGIQSSNTPHDDIIYEINPLPANHDNSHFQSLLLPNEIPVIWD